MFFHHPNPPSTLEGHVSQFGKLKAVYSNLRNIIGVPAKFFSEHAPASDEQLLAAHTPEFISDLRNYRLTDRTRHSELLIKGASSLPKEFVDLHISQGGGAIAAARYAIEHGGAVLLGGGHHHASSDYAEGFCYVNDLAVCIQFLINDGTIQRGATVDLDVHHGNGQAKIFSESERVGTFSMHEYDIYPFVRGENLEYLATAQSTRDVELPRHLGGKQYLEILAQQLPTFLDQIKPELILYQAGVDPYINDRLGGLELSMEDMRLRDKLVVESAKTRKIPIVATFGGGYALNPEDTIFMHTNTCREMFLAFAG